MNVPIVRRQIALLRAMLRRTGHRTFLEVGCGEGHVTRELASMGLTGVAVDREPEAIRIARRKGIAGVRFREQDLLDLEDRDHELCLALFILEHIEDDERALAKLHELLRRGGHLILSVPAHADRYSHQDRMSGHHRRYDRAVLERMLRRQGFSVERVLCFGFPISNAYTRLYNAALGIRGVETVRAQNTGRTGIVDEARHFPRPIRGVSRLAFPLLTAAVRLDRPFLRTDLGTHYLVRAAKV